MHKEAYFTENNSCNKIQTWKNVLLEYKEHWKEFHPENSALLIIDMQQYFLDKKSHAYVSSSPVIIKNVVQLLAAYRKKHLPVIFTFFAVKDGEENPIKNWWHESVSDGSSESKIVNILKPRPSEKVIRKNTYSAFYNTDVEQFLKQNGVKNIVMSGVLTNLCCETTAREAFIRNFDVFFLIDATAAYNEELHLSSLRTLSYGFATPVTTKDVLQKNGQKEK